jgi:hypothetical protein
MNQKRYHYEINNILKREERRLYSMFKILITYIRLKKYIKWGVWMVAVCLSYI